MRRLDVVIAAGFAVYAALNVVVLDEVGGPAWVSGPLLVAAGIALAWRRSSPLWSAVGVAGALAAQALITMQAPEGLVVSGPMLVSAYSVAAHGRGREALLWLPIAVAAGAAHTIGDPLVRTAEDVEDASFWWLALLAAWFVGLAVHRHRQARDLREVAERLERERDEAAARERTRMARELHDVVSHGVSVIALQAGAAQETLTGDPDRTRERLAAIEQTARDSAAELRRMLGVLRDASGEGEPGRDGAANRSGVAGASHRGAGGAGAPLVPLPGVRDVPPLVESLRAAGLPVTLRVEGDAEAVAPSVQHSAYRVVQEGLTNVVKHARASRVEVVVRRSEDGLEVIVADDGPPVARNGTTPAGFGLVGLRERVAVHGGTLDAGRSDDGFVLRAHLVAERS